MNITKIQFPDNTIADIKDAALTNRVSEMDEILGSSLNDLNGRVEAVKEVIPSSASASNKVVTQSDIANFITKSVNDLTNYYTKSQTYTQTEVNSLIGAINQFKYEIYASTSAVTNPQSNVLYLIGPTGSGADKYEEYVYANSTWTKIGDTTIDLSDYVTTSALNTALTAISASIDSMSASIPSAPGTLDTTYSASQATAASESLSGTIKLHKVSKTGDYEDLNNLPSIPAVSFDVSGSMLVVTDPSLDDIELELASI